MSRSRKSVAVTGLGAITCLGDSAEEFFRRVRAGESALQHGLGLLPEANRSAAAARALDSKKLQMREPALRERLAESEALSLAWIAANEALAEAGWDGLGAEDGLILASTTGQVQYWESALMGFLRDGSGTERFAHVYGAQPLGTLQADLQKLFRHGGPTTLVASACSAATQAIALATFWIRSGKTKRCLVGGVELLCRLTRSGFDSFQLLAKENCRPFDRSRGGINLSEGVAFLCLEAAEAKNPASYGFVRGAGSASDGCHMTAPHPEGAGYRRAMELALCDAGLEPAAIDWIHAHGTGSLQNDIAESTAIHSLFGDKSPPVTSTKGAHGHALGASGALESLLVLKAMRAGTLLPTTGFAEADPAIRVAVTRGASAAPLRHVMKSTLGFGGVNASLIFSQEARA